jgi:beta-xylosidase
MRSLMYIILLFVVLSSCAAKPEGANSAAISGRYTNPVLFNLADPCILLYDGTYYMSGTGDNVSYYIYTSKDLVNWSKGNRIFGPGSEKDFWAPDIFYSHSDKTFYLYYTVNYKIGVASSSTPDGKYKDLGILIKSSGDAQMFQDTDGSFYLYYSSNFTEIYVQPMSNPVTLKGFPKRLLTFDQGWDSPRNEAPWIFKRNNIYYLLYSGNNADLRNYAIGCATSSNPAGPFKKYEANPIISQNSNVYGPGSCCVIENKNGEYWLLYHQKDFPGTGFERSICLDKLWFDESGILHGIATKYILQPSPKAVNN